jgi:hypothetical protein
MPPLPWRLARCCTRSGPLGAGRARFPLRTARAVHEISGRTALRQRHRSDDRQRGLRELRVGRLRRAPVSRLHRCVHGLVIHLPSAKALSTLGVDVGHELTGDDMHKDVAGVIVPVGTQPAGSSTRRSVPCFLSHICQLALAHAIHSRGQLASGLRLTRPLMTPVPQRH